MTTRRADPIRYLADENAIGLAKVLIREHGRTDVRHVGQAELPEIPRGTPDLQWLAWAGQRGWIVLTRDRRIRTRPAELRAFREHGVRVVWIGGKRDHSARDLAALFLKHEQRLQRVATKLGTGPWVVNLTPSGVRQLRLRER